MLDYTIGIIMLPFSRYYTTGSYSSCHGHRPCHGLCVCEKIQKEKQQRPVSERCIMCMYSETLCKQCSEYTSRDEQTVTPVVGMLLAVQPLFQSYVQYTPQLFVVGRILYLSMARAMARATWLLSTVDMRFTHASLQVGNICTGKILTQICSCPVQEESQGPRLPVGLNVVSYWYSSQTHV